MKICLRPKNWCDFQHYKDRAPAWIKLHKKLLDNYAFHSLPVESRALAPMLWLLASEFEEGVIEGSVEEIAFRLRLTVDAFEEAIQPLVKSQFFDNSSDLLAKCYQPASPEKEREEEKEKEYCSFEEFWESYPHPRNRGAKEKAKQLFSKLPNPEKQAAMASLAEYVAILRDPAHSWLKSQMAKTYLFQKTWTGFEPDKPKPLTAEERQKRLSYFAKTGKWSERWGPRPAPKEKENPHD